MMLNRERHEHPVLIGRLTVLPIHQVGGQRLQRTDFGRVIRHRQPTVRSLHDVDRVLQAELYATDSEVGVARNRQLHFTSGRILYQLIEQLVLAER
jgi:hypothetical protein